MRKRTNEICSDLRRRIVTGELPPADRIPTHTELVERYGVSSVTVQNALATLSDEGFIEAKGRQGRFVAEKPPHLSRFALLVPHDETFRFRISALYDLLARHSAPIAREMGCEVSTFRGYEGWRSLEDYRRLVEEMESDRLAGVVFGAPPHALEGTPIVDLPDVPRVAIMERVAGQKIDSVWVDHASMLQRTLSHFRDRGRSRVAILGMEGSLRRVDDVPAEAARGLDVRPQWIQAAPLHAPEWAENVVRLLMSGSRGNRPDCLFISDDNFVEPATRTLHELGVNVPDDLDVVGHANLPWPTKSHLPVRRIGFRLDECLRHCFRTILARRRGARAVRHRTLPAVFEDELDLAGETAEPTSEE